MTNLTVHLFFALYFVIYLMDSHDALSIIPNCPFEDTVNITGSKRFSNGSYLYEGVLIPPNMTGSYEYIENEGKSQKVARHLRGCVCQIKNCFKLCCTPRERLLEKNQGWECVEFSDKDKYTLNINISLSDGSEVLKNVLKEFVVQVGIPCEKGYMLDPYIDEWRLYENGTFLRLYDKKALNRSGYCMSASYNNSGVFQLQPYNCGILVLRLEFDTNIIVMLVSLPFLLLTILTYWAIPELYKSLYYKCLICYMFSIIIANTMIIMINLRTKEYDPVPCGIIGSVAYYFYLGAFFWLNIICFDIWASFTHPFTAAQRYSKRKNFRNYSLYAWGLPMLMTVVTMTLQLSSINTSYKSGIGESHCWLKTDNWSAMMYFHGPCFLLITINTVLFYLTARKIYCDCKEIKEVSRSMNSSSHTKSHEHSVWLFFRLFVVMGISWILEMIGYIVGEKNSSTLFFKVADLFNASQGLIIFALFVMKKSTLLLIKKRITTSDHEH
ncbi:G-protein coupled receptor Mth2 [Bactrocera oleae]|uniref:G-protein coupled receptor Mth2 n=1 Tax=Bactrocera oleae TaxID=104688 RepID=UPI00387EDDDF